MYQFIHEVQSVNHEEMYYAPKDEVQSVLHEEMYYAPKELHEYSNLYRQKS